jgi:hypothetical protein
MRLRQVVFLVLIRGERSQIIRLRVVRRLLQRLRDSRGGVLKLPGGDLGAANAELCVERHEIVLAELEYLFEEVFGRLVVLGRECRICL